MNKTAHLIRLYKSIEMSELSANSVDPDHTTRSASSDLRLLCLSISLLWDARHKYSEI